LNILHIYSRSNTQQQIIHVHSFLQFSLYKFNRYLVPSDPDPIKEWAKLQMENRKSPSKLDVAHCLIYLDLLKQFQKSSSFHAQIYLLTNGLRDRLNLLLTRLYSELCKCGPTVQLVLLKDWLCALLNLKRVGKHDTGSFFR
jgi:hypothetical protein